MRRQIVQKLPTLVQAQFIDNTSPSGLAPCTYNKFTVAARQGKQETNQTEAYRCAALKQQYLRNCPCRTCKF